MSRRCSGRWVRATLGFLYYRDGRRCGRCGEIIDPRFDGNHPLGGTVGHVTPLARGGSNHVENLRAEHRSCNVSAGARVAPIQVEPEPAARMAEPYD